MKFQYKQKLETKSREWSIESRCRRQKITKVDSWVGWIGTSNWAHFWEKPDSINCDEDLCARMETGVYGWRSVLLCVHGWRSVRTDEDLCCSVCTNGVRCEKKEFNQFSTIQITQDAQRGLPGNGLAIGRFYLKDYQTSARRTILLILWKKFKSGQADWKADWKAGKRTEKFLKAGLNAIRIKILSLNTRGRYQHYQHSTTRYT